MFVIIIMIMFVFGIMVMVAGVGAVEGSAGLTTGFMIGVLGAIIMTWGLVGMAKKGQL